MAWLVDCVKVLRDSSKDDCCLGGVQIKEFIEEWEDMLVGG